MLSRAERLPVEENERGMDDPMIQGIAEDQRRGVFATLVLRLRAWRGDPEAQYVVGRTLMYGSGLPAPDDAAALHWLMRAAAGGHPGAARLIEIIERNEG